MMVDIKVCKTERSDGATSTINKGWSKRVYVGSRADSGSGSGSTRGSSLAWNDAVWVVYKRPNFFIFFIFAWLSLSTSQFSLTLSFWLRFLETQKPMMLGRKVQTARLVPPRRPPPIPRAAVSGGLLVKDRHWATDLNLLYSDLLFLLPKSKPF